MQGFNSPSLALAFWACGAVAELRRVFVVSVSAFPCRCRARVLAAAQHVAFWGSACSAVTALASGTGAVWRDEVIASFARVRILIQAALRRASVRRGARELRAYSATCGLVAAARSGVDAVLLGARDADAGGAGAGCVR